MFCDYAKINLSAGKGGDGAISFHHEKFIDKGGPDGGDGGKGGNVVLISSENINTLTQYIRCKKFKADDGAKGSKKKMAGASGSDLILKVPVGTILFEVDSTGKQIPIYDFTANDQTFIPVFGGKGGFGNAHFTSSVRQIPRFCELGEPGESKKIILELKTIADVGLIGLPNSGKSTFLSSVTKARPKIANYAFTTLVPHLGIIDTSDSRIVVADIPGLIEGASQGKGLGYDFLKHIERTRFLLHMIDIQSLDPVSDYLTVRHELKNFSQNLNNKPFFICFTKIDTIDWSLDSPKLKEYIHDFAKQIKYKKPIFVISAITRIGLVDLLNKIQLAVSKIPASTIEIINNTEKDIAPSKITKIKDHVFQIDDQKMEVFASKTDYENHESVNRLRDILCKNGYNKKFKSLGVKPGDIIKIKKYQIEW
jgi:GTP-binding protein